jgi:hypothetical protein
MSENRFPPVSLLSGDSEPWGMPQVLPGEPMRAPKNAVLPRRWENTIIGAGETDDGGGGGESAGLSDLPSSASGAAMMAPSTPGWAQNLASTDDEHAPPMRDPHHYAKVVGLFTTPTNGVSNKFLDAPSGKRNWLAFRNTSAVANIYVEFGRDASTNSVFRLTPNAILFFDTVVSQDDVYAVADAVGAVLSYSYSNIA